MYLDAMSFLEDDLEGWRGYGTLLDLSDEELSIPVVGAHGWSGRDLIAHMVAWQEHALAVARELAINETSPTKVRGDADWAARGDELNDEITRTWRELPMTEVRHRMAVAAGELRGHLTVVPETRWVKNSEMLRFFLGETVDHYEEHRSDLEAVLAAAAG
ncbi:MAG TPA: maleylpyruvate isomerase N-terminal domain-containing protein [Candidatus Saccharimonadales bacterium]|nr:maleylpyruvate isomerase N-terminal domain-containing protein [Candidatus Saccharimonadales bacterium]